SSDLFMKHRFNWSVKMLYIFQLSYNRLFWNIDFCTVTLNTFPNHLHNEIVFLQVFLIMLQVMLYIIIFFLCFPSWCSTCQTHGEHFFFFYFYQSFWCCSYETILTMFKSKHITVRLRS